MQVTYKLQVIKTEDLIVSQKNIPVVAKAKHFNYTTNQLPSLFNFIYYLLLIVNYVKAMIIIRIYFRKHISMTIFFCFFCYLFLR